MVWSGSVGGEVYNYWWILDEANTMIVTNKKEIMFSGANSKYTDDYKSSDINPEQISIILENFRNNKVNR